MMNPAKQVKASYCFKEHSNSMGSNLQVALLKQNTLQVTAFSHFSYLR